VVVRGSLAAWRKDRHFWGRFRLRSHCGRSPLLCPLWFIRTSPLRPRHVHFKLKSRHTPCRHRCRLPDRERSNKRLEDPRRTVDACPGLSAWPKIPPYFFLSLVIPGRLVDFFAESVASKLLGFVPASHGTHPKTAMLQRDGSSIFASADCNNVRAAVHIWPRLIEIARAKSRKDLSRPRLPARTRRRYISYRRTERSVPDGGLTSCRTSFALHVFGRTDRLKQSPVPTPGTSMLVRGRKMKCVTYADTLGSHRLVANATEVSNTSTAGGGWARG